MWSCALPSAFRKFPLLKTELLHVRQRLKPPVIHAAEVIHVDLPNRTRIS